MATPKTQLPQADLTHGHEKSTRGRVREDPRAEV